MLDVLLVCTGNICRSPIAEGLLADRSASRLDGALAVRSAGTWARPGRPPMAEALEAAAERGVDISGLRSSTLDPAVVTGSDVVLTMTAEQREEVLSAVPDAGPKTFTLKELVRLLAALPPAAPGAGREAALDRIRDANRIRATGEAVVGDEDVSDPLGMSVDTYRAVAWEIEGLVDELLSGLFGSPRPEPAGEAKRVWG